MKRIVFTKHAEEMLTARSINREMVMSCLTQPTQVVHARENKRAYLKDFDNNYLKAIVAEEKDAFIVVTAYWFAKNRIKQ